MRRLHLVFIVAAFALILAVLLGPRVGEGGETGNALLERSYDVAPAEGVVCCSWQDGDRERRCVAAPGQACDVCAGACG